MQWLRARKKKKTKEFVKVSHKMSYKNLPRYVNLVIEKKS
jgi:hypothetical protein